MSFLCEPKNNKILIATLLWRLLLSKPWAIIKPPSNKKIIGFAYGVETSLKDISDRVGMNMSGKSAVIDNGIALEIHQKDIRNKRLATNHEFSDKLAGGGTKFKRKKREIPKKIINVFTNKISTSFFVKIILKNIHTIEFENKDFFFKE